MTLALNKQNISALWKLVHILSIGTCTLCKIATVYESVAIPNWYVHMLQHLSLILIKSLAIILNYLTNYFYLPASVSNSLLPIPIPSITVSKRKVCSKEFQTLVSLWSGGREGASYFLDHVI